MVSSNPTNSADAYVDWKPIAERLGLRQRAFWKLVHEDGLPSYHINARVYRFRWSEVERWMSAFRKGGY